MLRFLCTSALLAAATATAAPVPTVPQDPTKDREGNPLPKGVTARLGSLAYRGKDISLLAFSPDGRRLLYVEDAPNSDKGRVFAWDADTGKPLPTRTFERPAGEYNWAGAVAGDRVVWLGQPVGMMDREYSAAVVRDLGGAEVSGFRIPKSVPRFTALSYKATNPATSASVTPDGKYLAAITDQDTGVTIYDLDTGKELFRRDLNRVAGGWGDPGVQVSPDGKTLYLTRTGPVRRFELRTGKELAAVADTDERIDTLRASPDGKRLVTRGTVVTEYPGGGWSTTPAKELVVRDVAADKTLGKLGVGATPVDFRFAGPDTLIVLAAEFRSSVDSVHTFSRWNLATLKREWEAPAPPRFVHLAVSADGKRFAATDREHAAHVYEVATGKPVVPVAGHFGGAWVGFSPDGTQIFTESADGVRMWWTPTGERKRGPDLPVGPGRDARPLSRDALVWLARSADGKAELIGWDRAKGVATWRAAVDGPVPNWVLTHDGRRCVWVSWDPARPGVWDVTVYDGPAGKKLHTWPLKRPLGGIPRLVLSPDGAVLLHGGDGFAGLDVATGKEVFRYEAEPLKSSTRDPEFPMSLTADGTRVAVIARTGAGHALRLFELKSGKKLAERDLGNNLFYPWVNISPDGKLAAVSHHYGTAVQVYDLASDRAAPRKLDAGPVWATAAAFNPDGASLAVGYQDGTALVWDLTAK